MRNSLGRDWALKIDATIAAKGLTKTKVADRANIEVRTLDRWFEPEPPDPGFSNVVAVCRVLQIPVESLLTAEQKGGAASSISNVQILRTVADALSGAAEAAEIDELVPDHDSDAQQQAGA